MSAPRPRTGSAYLDSQGRLRAARVRADFPLLGREVHARPLVYLDSAASAQQPGPVLAAVDHYATHLHANVHRGVHTLSQEATSAFESARETVRRFINAHSTREIVFTRRFSEGSHLVTLRLDPDDRPGATRQDIAVDVFAQPVDESASHPTAEAPGTAASRAARAASTAGRRARPPSTARPPSRSPPRPTRTPPSRAGAATAPGRAPPARSR